MQLIDLLSSPWAIVPERLLEIQAIYAKHRAGDKIDIAAIEARLGRPLANEQQEYSVQAGGVAVLPVEGAISPKANLFTRVSGGTTAQMLQIQLESAMADSRVRSIVLAIDSPGGSVFGTPEFAASVQQFATEKPIVALSDGLMASAAYWIGSAANAVYITGPTVQVGSIGVVATHDFRPDRMGGQTTEITAGRYKRIATSNAPLTEEGRAYIQEQVDHLYQVFVDTVAQHRGVSAQVVLDRMADGRIFIGQQAIDAGLVDGVSSRQALVEALASGQYRPQRMQVAAGGAGPRAASATPAIPSPPKGDSMDLATLKKDHPELAAALAEEAAGAERARIQGVLGVALPGHEALVQTLAFDGKTQPGEAALAVNTAERNALAAAGTTLRAERPAPVAAAPIADPVADAAAKSAEDAAPAGTPDERARATWEADAKLRSEFASFESYSAWFKANDRGAIRVLGAKAK